jgi:hypothetical protein
VEDLRQSCYRILWVVSLAVMTARVCSAERVYEPSIHKPDPSNPNQEAIAATRNWPSTRPQPMPTFGSNDRSRWATIRALVEDGTFVIGRRETQEDGTWRDSGRIFEPGYDSVDKVMDPKTQLFYSTKPPLLTMLLAGEYWLMHQCGLTMDSNRWLVVRFMAWTENVLPLGLFLWLFAGIVERHGRTDWGRLFTYATACFGTFLGTFAVTLNNHIPAAVAAYLSVHLLLTGRGLSLGRLAACGLFAGLAASFELPAVALLVGLLFMMLRRAPRFALIGFLPAALLPIAAQLELNYLAVGEVQPVYAKIGGAGREWYEYPGSHWARKPDEVKKGIDWAKDYESRGMYAFHLLLGHHGVFSLTPVWLLAFAALIRNLTKTRSNADIYSRVLVLTLVVSIAVGVFYAAITGVVNYGGWTSGARWFFWLTPLWLLAILQTADNLAGSRFGRGVGLMCLAVSVFSASYPAWNPWRHPWLYNWMEYSGLIPYGK